MAGPVGLSGPSPFEPTTSAGVAAYGLGGPAQRSAALYPC